MHPLTHISSYANHSSTKAPSIRLPSLDDFDRGVDAIARSHESARAWSFSSSVPSLSHRSIAPKFARPYGSVRSRSFSTSFTSLRHRPIAPKPPSSTVAPSSHESTHPKHVFVGGFGPSRLDGSSRPPADRKRQYDIQKEKHVNQKYTIEQGDFIIYFWHDKKLNWQDIKNQFASQFGHSPKRTVQGLQSQYYRMNDRIPLWDDDGWLIFGNEEDMEPIYTSIKCRERETQRMSIESLGLGQRYPERAIDYSWVDTETKRKCRDWATKRNVQLRERAEQRVAREQRAAEEINCIRK